MVTFYASTERINFLCLLWEDQHAHLTLPTVHSQNVQLTLTKVCSQHVSPMPLARGSTIYVYYDRIIHTSYFMPPLRGSCSQHPCLMLYKAISHNPGCPKHSWHLSRQHSLQALAPSLTLHFLCTLEMITHGHLILTKDAPKHSWHPFKLKSSGTGVIFHTFSESLEMTSLATCTPQAF